MTPPLPSELFRKFIRFGIVRHSLEGAYSDLVISIYTQHIPSHPLLAFEQLSLACDCAQAQQCIIIILFHHNGHHDQEPSCWCVWDASWMVVCKAGRWRWLHHYWTSQQTLPTPVHKVLQFRVVNMNFIQAFIGEGANWVGLRSSYWSNPRCCQPQIVFHSILIN